MVMGRVAALVVMGVFAGGALAQDAGGVRPGPGRGGNAGRMFEVRVSGHGEVSAAPDLAVLQVGASEQEKTAVDAQKKVNEEVGGMVEKIKGLGIAAEKIQTARLELQPVYSDRPRREGRPEVVGYRANSSVRVEVSDLSKIGDVVDAALAAGGNQFEGISFQLKDDKAARGEALKKAVADGRGKAEAIAEAAGVKLGALTDVAESSAGPGYPVPMFGARLAMAQMAADAGTPVSPGEVKVTADVVMAYRYAEK